MRELTSHTVAGASTDTTLRIFVLDEPGSGGAHHAYMIFGANPNANGSIGSMLEASADMPRGMPVLFQNGPIGGIGLDGEPVPGSGVNGVTHEALLAILVDRLECFQGGPYACVENGAALHHLIQAQNQLQLRTTKRMARGVEGTTKL